MNTFTMLFFTLFTALSAVVSAMPVDISTRDVFVPPIEFPHAGTVWKVGEEHHVVWSTADAPVNITNSLGMVVLAQNNRIFVDQPGGLNQPLASNFSILLGRIPVTVPQVPAGDNYQVVLFGDSGNFSPMFTIN